MSSESTAQDQLERDLKDLHDLGYSQKLRRTIGPYTSFALGFAMVSITAAIFTAYSSAFTTIGGIAIWLWIPVTLGILVITAVYAHLSARIPLTGYAYQWSARLVNRDFGWFTGWTALLAFVAGTAGLAVAMGSVFAPYVWSNPTNQQIQLFATAIIIVAVVANSIGVRAATWVNNIGASVELVGTLGLAAITLVGLFFFSHREGPKILFDTNILGGGAITLTAIGLATLLPVYTLIGWEGSADLAEETRDPRRTAGRAMFRTVVISAIGGFAIFAIFSMAIPNGVPDAFNRSESPIIYILRSQFGQPIASLMVAIAFIAMLSALLANVAVATRLVYSLARDRMLPGWQFLERVNPRTRTPLYVILLVGAFALLLNFLSAGIVAQVVSIVSVCYYGTYLLTLAAILWAVRSGTMPSAPAGYYDLGRWLKPFAWAGIVFTLVIIAAMTLPNVNQVAGRFTIYAELIGIAWYLVFLRRQIRLGRAGAHLQPLPAAEAPEEVEVVRESGASTIGASRA
jgi:amino acid transporter